MRRGRGLGTIWRPTRSSVCLGSHADAARTMESRSVFLILELGSELGSEEVSIVDDDVVHYKKMLFLSV